MVQWYRWFGGGWCDSRGSGLLAEDALAVEAGAGTRVYVDVILNWLGSCPKDWRYADKTKPAFWSVSTVPAGVT